MKKYLLFLSSAFLYGNIIAQTLVGTSPTPVNVVLEEYTGIYCPNCPDGHARAQALYNAYPGRVNLINLHSSTTYSAPRTTGVPDLRTPSSVSLASFSANGYYPAAMVNRRQWSGWVSGQNGQSAPYYPFSNNNPNSLGRGGWMAAGSNVINGGDSPVNIGVRTTWDTSTSQLTIDIELYYTSAQSGNNSLQVALLQNNIIAYQSGSTNPSYVHNHVFRTFINGPTGEVLSTPTAGQLITKSYVYTVPASYSYGSSPAVNCNIDDCEIVVFVTDQTFKNTLTGVTCDAKNGQIATGMEENFVGLSNASVFPNPVDETSTVNFSLSGSQKTSIEVFNLLGAKVLVQELGVLNKGTHSFPLDFITNQKAVSKGIYLMKIDAGANSSVIKISL